MQVNFFCQLEKFFKQQMADCWLRLLSVSRLCCLLMGRPVMGHMLRTSASPQCWSRGTGLGCRGWDKGCFGVLQLWGPFWLAVYLKSFHQEVKHSRPITKRQRVEEDLTTFMSNVSVLICWGFCQMSQCVSALPVRVLLMNDCCKCTRALKHTHTNVESKHGNEPWKAVMSAAAPSQVLGLPDVQVTTRLFIVGAAQHMGEYFSGGTS